MPLFFRRSAAAVGATLFPAPVLTTVLTKVPALVLVSILASTLASSVAWAEPLSQPPSFSLAASPAAAQTGYATVPLRSGAGSIRPFSQLAVGVKISTLGAGLELATPLARKFNLRVGGNFFQYTDHLTTDGIHYAAALDFSSAQASVDWFPWGRSFHLSPGALVYSGNRITANGSVPGGTSFTVNDNNYLSDPADPVGGGARIDFAHAAPMLTLGWGNILPRSKRNFSIPFELGAAYVGDPKVGLNFSGSVCDAQQLGCESVQSDPEFQSDVAAERTKIQKDANYARFYPILSLGLAYRF